MSIVVGICSFILFVLFQAQGIPTGDSGDLVTAAAIFGVPHPPGYPLYSFLGWILTKIPLYTVSWRVGLLSSIPHAIVVSLLFDIIWVLTKKKTSALFASFLICGNYLFFLYSTTPEVFALLDLFVISLIWLAVRRRFFLMSLVFGLALSHHHMILFLLPAVTYMYYKRFPWVYIFPFAVGLLPYIYIPIAASADPIINWDHATTLHNFIRLISRADYGTFQSGAIIGIHPWERFFQLRALGNFFLVDFGVVGVLLTGIGFWYIWKLSRKMFLFLLPAIFCMGPLFFFYASYPIANRFTLATFERFMLPMYVMIAIVIGIGHAKIMTVLAHSRFLVGILIVGFLYPITLGVMTLWRFWGLPQDRTAEHFATDVFIEVPQGSLVALGRDTTLFTAQYIRYGLGYRNDIYLVHGSILNSPEYQNTLKKVFSDLAYPDISGESFLSEFLVSNAKTKSVFSNIQYPVKDHWHWIPHGLLFELTSEDRLGQASDMIERNDRIWTAMHDPTQGILSRYNHLMLSDVLDVYAGSRIQYGRLLLKLGQAEFAKTQFLEAVRLGGDTQLSDAYMYTGLSHLFLDECDQALTAFHYSKTASLFASNELPLYEAITYRDCASDSARAQELFSKYETSRQQAEQPLEED